jgi:hypothetical protein
MDAGTGTLGNKSTLGLRKQWRRLRGFDYLAKVITGVKFRDGIEVTAVDQAAA